MKLRAQREGLAVRATVATAIHAKDTIMAITGNRTVDKAGANANPIGRLVVPPKAIGGIGTVETKFKELVEIKTGGALAAGVAVKLQAVDGTTGENVVTTWVGGTDSFERLYGVVWNGTAGVGVAEVLVY
jgi:hypothetical protein